MRVRGRGGSTQPDHPIRSNRHAWFCSQSNFITFMYPSDGSPFGCSLGTDSLCVDWLNTENLPLVGDRVFHRIFRYSCQHILTSDISKSWHQKPLQFDPVLHAWTSPLESLRPYEDDSTSLERRRLKSQLSKFLLRLLYYSSSPQYQQQTQNQEIVEPPN